MQKNVVVAQQISHSDHGRGKIRNVSLAVPEKEIFALIGLSGSGKTSLLKLLSGFEQPERGILALFGNPEPSFEEYRRVGSVLESGGFYEKISANANLKMKALALGNYKRELTREAIRITGLEKVARKRVISYSEEQKIRLGIAMAIIGSPKLLLLDEVLDSISGKEREELLKLIKKLNQKYGLTVLITSQDAQTVQKIATWYGVIRKGMMTAQFPAEQLAQYQHELIELQSRQKGEEEGKQR